MAWRASASFSLRGWRSAVAVTTTNRSVLRVPEGCSLCSEEQDALSIWRPERRAAVRNPEDSRRGEPPPRRQREFAANHEPTSMCFRPIDDLLAIRGKSGTPALAGDLTGSPRVRNDKDTPFARSELNTIIEPSEKRTARDCFKLSCVICTVPQYLPHQIQATVAKRSDA